MYPQIYYGKTICAEYLVNYLNDMIWLNDFKDNYISFKILIKYLKQNWYDISILLSLVKVSDKPHQHCCWQDNDVLINQDLNLNKIRFSWIWQIIIMFQCGYPVTKAVFSSFLQCAQKFCMTNQNVHNSAELSLSKQIEQKLVHLSDTGNKMVCKN